MVKVTGMGISSETKDTKRGLAKAEDRGPFLIFSDESMRYAETLKEAIYTRIIFKDVIAFRNYNIIIRKKFLCKEK